jgi:hypothetical protein
VSSTFWTERHFTGLALILGALLFLCGAGLYTAVRDTKGSLIFGLPPREWLRVVFDHPHLWQLATILFISGVIVTVLGLALLTTLFRDAGDQMFSQLGLVAFVFGAVLWIIHLAFRLRVDPWAAQETARTAALPEFYVPLTMWIHALFLIYTILAFSAMLAYGGAVLSTHLLPQWVGWTTIVYSLAGLGLLGFTGDAPPFLHHLMPLLIGIILLL